MLKKILLISLSLVLILISNSNQVEAQIYAVSPIGSPIVSENSILQNYMMRLRENRDWNLTVKAQEPYWVNSENPNIRIPTTNTEITTSEGSYRISSDKEVEIYEGDRTPYTILPFFIRVDNLKGVPSGTYSLNLVFDLNGDIFNTTITINIASVLDIVTTVPTSYINFTEAQVFNLKSEVANDIDTQINIVANSKWELYLDVTNFGNSIGNYSFEVLSGEGNNLVLVNKNKTPIRMGQSYLIAVGDPSYTENRPPIEIPTYIRIRYYLNNNTLSYFPEGSFTNYITYRIQEK